ncbi:unnamed protein product [Rotaria magnacalcarata]|uniref:Uncharacterized protein n=1 Tax=Rotaria magnacalcarata TaxID=392030 RepID=A0A8S2RY88_9BILA|nr:unnamed protein product [Rotaria magnacalcarata]
MSSGTIIDIDQGLNRSLIHKCLCLRICITENIISSTKTSNSTRNFRLKVLLIFLKILLPDCLTWAVVGQPITSPMIASQQSIVTTDIDANYSTASILIPSSKGKASNALVCKLVKQAQNGNETNLVRKREVHKRIEADRRE